MRRITVLILVFSTIAVYTVRSQSNDWPVYRGKSDLSGKSEWKLPDNPKILWTYNAGGRTKSSPVVGEGIIYFGTEKGSLIACEYDGRLKWKIDAGSSVDAPPMLSGDKVIYSTSEGALKAADRKTGRNLWTYKTENQIAGSANLWSAGGKSGLIVGSYDFFLHCVNPENGKMMWKIETENYVNGTPAYIANKVVFGGCDGIVRIIDPVSGKQKSTVNVGIYMASSPALAGQLGFIGDYEGNFYCLNISASKIVWQVAVGDDASSIIAVPALDIGVVVIGSDDKSIYCYSVADGSAKWKFRTNGSIKGSAVIAGDRVLFGSDDGYVYILGLNDGLKKWSFNCGSPISSSPAVTKNRFYILTEDGRLLAFGIK